MKQVTPLGNTWEHIYHANLLSVYLAGGEIINHTFELHNPEDYVIENPAREFRKEFSDVMANWIISGEIEISEEMLALNPNAAKYETEFTTFDDNTICTAYGPRIKDQIEYVMGELQRDLNSRRACIMMLGSDDQHVAEAMAKGDTKCEYICTLAYTFRINVKGQLDVVVSMRSNNYTTTVCQDVYVVHKLWEEVAKAMELEQGVYYHSAVSAHIFEGEDHKAEHILDSYIRWVSSQVGLTGQPLPVEFDTAVGTYLNMKSLRLAKLEQENAEG